MTCDDCQSPAAPNHHLCNRCHERQVDDRYERELADSCAKLEGEREVPLMWRDDE